jgi:CTD small phosphatase-like protein 2
MNSKLQVNSALIPKKHNYFSKIKIKKIAQQHPYSHLVRGQLLKKEEFKNFCTLTYKHLLYSIRCLKGPSDKFIKFKQVELDDLPSNFFEILLFNRT